MSKTFAYLSLAALSLAALPMVAALDPNSTIDNDPCAQNGRTGNTIFALGLAVGLNWSPDCITVTNGETITWTAADAEPVHAPRLSAKGLGCWDGEGGLVAPTDTDALGLSWDGARLQAHLVSHRTTVDVARDFACDPADPATHGISLVTDENGREVVEVLYQCILHGAGMEGKIRIKL